MSISAELVPSNWAGGEREDFVLTGALGGPTLSLNGSPLEQAANGSLPALYGERKPQGALQLGGRSSFFAVFPGANAAACLH